MATVKDLLALLMDAYFVVDAERRVLDHNRTFLDLTGSRKTAVHENATTQCYDLVKLDICEKNCIALRALKAGRAVQVNEIHGKSLDGRDLVLMGSAAPLTDTNNNVTSVVVTYRDVTEESSLRDKLHQLDRDSRQEKEVLLKNLTEKTQELEQLKKAIAAPKRRGRPE